MSGGAKYKFYIPQDLAYGANPQKGSIIEPFMLAHLFFSAALGYLFWDVGRNAFPGKGWRYLQIFCVLMILWNLVAFSGHWLGFHIADSDIISPSGYFSSQIMGPLSAIKLIYFSATLDHLLSVPALYFLFLSLRSLYHSSDEEKEK